LIIQALRYLGQARVADKTPRWLKSKLSDADARALMKDVAYVPAWTGNILRQAAKGD
jgi:hypothetical protein